MAAVYRTKSSPPQGKKTGAEISEERRNQEVPRDAPALTSDRCERDAGSLLKLSVAIFP